MKWLNLVCVLAVGGVLQTLTPAFWFLGQAKIPLLPAAVLYYALHEDTDVVLVAAVLGGFFQDVLSCGPLGGSALVFCGLAWAANRFRALVWTDCLTVQCVFGGFVGAAATLGVFVLLAARGPVVWPISLAAFKAFGAGLLGAIWTPVVFRGVHSLDRVAGRGRAPRPGGRKRHVHGARRLASG